MADEILRSRHAFGNLVDVATALETKKIDEHDILFLDGDTKPKIGWIDKNKNVKLVDTECVIVVDELPKSGQEGKVYIFGDEGYFWNGVEFVNFCKSTDLTELENALNALNTTVVDLKTEVDAIKENISELQTNINDLQTEVEQKANADEVEEKIEQANLEVIDLIKSYTDKQIEERLVEVESGWEIVEF